MEGLIRKSRREQIKWLEGTLKIPLTKDLPSWPHFIEINERRNLITHTGGVVSDEYISNVKEVGFPDTQNIKLGERLYVDFIYYQKAVNIFYEIGIKLIQVVWRKILPNELHVADDELIGAGYKLILSERYELAEEIHRFACNVLPRHSSDERKKILVVDYANTLNLQKRHEEASTILDAHDWSASAPKFRISIAAVKNEIPKVVDLIREIGANGYLTEQDYQEWPVFRNVRDSEDFRNAYAEVFGKPFQPLIPTTKVNLSHLQEVLSMKGLGEIKRKDVLELTPS